LSSNILRSFSTDTSAVPQGTDSLPNDYFRAYEEDIFKVLPSLAFGIDSESQLTFINAFDETKVFYKAK